MSRAVPRFKRVNPSLPLVGAGNGVVLYRIWGSIEGQLTISTFMFSAAVPNPTQNQLITLLANISTNLYAGYRACLSADWTATKETLDAVHRNDINGIQTTVNAGTAGTRAAGHEPTEVAIQLIRYTAVKGQHGRGRLGLPAVATADVTASRVSAAALITNLATLGTDMLLTASDGANTWTPCIGQRSFVPPKLVVGFAPLVKVTAPTLLGTVRRRKIGRGK